MYRLEKNGSKVAIFLGDIQVSSWFDVIYKDGLLSDESEYYIARKNNRVAIFKVVHQVTSKRVSDWFKSIDPTGLVKNQSKYYVARNSKYYFLFREDSREPLAKSERYISISGLVDGRSKYFVCQLDDGVALFSEDNFKEPISPLFRNIYATEVLANELEYYIAVRVEDCAEFAIYSVKDKEPRSQWFDLIYTDVGLFKKQSKYYIAYKDGQEAIFSIEDKDNPISLFWKDVSKEGLVSGTSDYYVAANKQGFLAIFHKDDKENPKSQWLWNIRTDKGLLQNESPYYLADNGKRDVVFHIDDPHTIVADSSTPNYVLIVKGYYNPDQTRTAKSFKRTSCS